MTQEIITVPAIARRHHADPSQISKTIKLFKIKTKYVLTKKTKKLATGISLRDYARLLKKYPALTLPKARVTDIPLTKIAEEIAKIRKWKKPDISTVLKMSKAKGIKLYRAKILNSPKKGSKGKASPTAMRPVVCMKQKDYKKFIKDL